jgi:hypothetical protein
LKCGAGSRLAELVWKIASCDSLAACSAVVRLRALQCLMAVLCTNSLKKVTGRNIDDIR